MQSGEKRRQLRARLQGASYNHLEQHDEKNLGMLVIGCGTATDKVCQKDGTDFIKFLSHLGKQASAKD